MCVSHLPEAVLCSSPCSNTSGAKCVGVPNLFRWPKEWIAWPPTSLLHRHTRAHAHTYAHATWTTHTYILTKPQSSACSLPSDTHAHACQRTCAVYCRASCSIVQGASMHTHSPPQAICVHTRAWEQGDMGTRTFIRLLYPTLRHSQSQRAWYCIVVCWMCPGLFLVSL